jgi:hypothetical protein
MNKDEKVFKDVCILLKQHNVNFWICHGTLLGIIRENRLLPWDHDIDFAVWDSEVSRELIISIFNNAGYQQEVVFGDMDCLHFYGKNKKIDVSFYKIVNDIASIKWIAPSEGVIMKACIDCVQIMCMNYDIRKIELAIGGFKRFVHISLLKISLIFKSLLTDKIKRIIYNSMVGRLNYKGYSYPIALMKFEDLQYNDFIIPIPVNSKRCLEITYGKDWAVPKKDYVWYEDAKNLVNLKEV